MYVIDSTQCHDNPPEGLWQIEPCEHGLEPLLKAGLPVVSVVVVRSVALDLGLRAGPEVHSCF